MGQKELTRHIFNNTLKDVIAHTIASKLIKELFEAKLINIEIIEHQNTHEKVIRVDTLLANPNTLKE
jgi:hypothetical protein